MAKTRVEIETEFKELVADKLGVPLNKITNTANFFSDLGGDSLDTAELLMAVEEKFSIKLEDDRVEDITTVDEALNYLLELGKWP
jgi:acyl carrier protein